MTAEARGLALVVAVLGAAMALPSTDGGAIAQRAVSAAGGLQCGVSQVRGAGIVEYRGTAVSPYSVVGEYSFQVSRSGPGGQSITRQAGMFELVPNAPRTLGTIVLDDSVDMVVEASLMLTVDGRGIACSSTA